MRDALSIGLKEAKDIVDKVWESWGGIEVRMTAEQVGLLCAALSQDSASLHIHDATVEQHANYLDLTNVRQVVPA
ncbi:hypothetical protein AVU67_gp09 [Ralstonia phage RSJ2]|uniref:Uncharacterized protein n=1 Tax=Ralstonia phage RSJ2 TaxID=1481785 RepID=A0A068Q6X8_9CAUD|nr:hypothetical protein AVU67_gp09 [Ralstonia phage RSJ2]BAP15815.1 hypothetical protein [Ralstonia phage RSJ2]